MKFNRPISIQYFRSVEGRDWPLLYLWLMKDFSWCGLHYFYSGMISGSLAITYTLYLVILNFRQNLYASSFLCVCLLGWLCANFVWMVGELFEQNVAGFDEDFFNKSTILAQKIGATTVLLNLVFFLFLSPGKILADKDGEVKNQIHPKLPAIIVRAFPNFTFKEYEKWHIFFWTCKDVAWVYFYDSVFAICFACTVLLNIDLLKRYASMNQTEQLGHYMGLFVWVMANGLWAIGELFYEVPNDALLSAQDWADFSFFSYPPSSLFLCRFVAGLLFITSGIVLLSFLVTWWVLGPPCDQRNSSTECKNLVESTSF